MTGSEFAQIVESVCRMWDREPLDGDSARLLFVNQFAELEASDVRVGVGVLFRKGGKFPPTWPEIWQAGARARDDRARREQQAREAAENRLGTGGSGVEAFARSHNGFSPVQVLRLRVGQSAGSPAFPEWHDPKRDIPGISRVETEEAKV